MDTLSPTPRVFSAHETQEPTLYLVRENDYWGDMLTMAYKENGFIKNYKQYTQNGTAYTEDRDAKTFQVNLMLEDTYMEGVLIIAFEKEDVLPMLEDTYKEDMLAITFEKRDGLLLIDKAAYRVGKDAKTFKGTLLIGDTFGEKNVVLEMVYKKYVWLAMNETANQEDMYDENYMKKNKILFDNGQEGTQQTNLVYKRGAKEESKRLAVSAIASWRGEKGA